MSESQEQQDPNTYEAVPVSENSLGIILKAEIDTQIATAKAFPRNLKKFLVQAEEMACISQSVAESCTYALKRKQWEDGKEVTKIIQGPSVRMAEIVVANYGNLRAAARIIGNDGKFITAQGMCHDLESNTMVNMEVKRRITNKFGKTFSEDMQVVTGNAACAIAFRNVVFKVIPAALTNDVYEKVVEAAKGTIADLPKRRDRALNYFRSIGVTDKQILDVLEIDSFEQINLEQLQILTGMKTSITTKEFTVEELFNVAPPATGESDNAKKATDATIKLMDDALNKKGGSKKKKEEVVQPTIPLEDPKA